MAPAQELGPRDGFPGVRTCGPRRPPPRAPSRSRVSPLVSRASRPLAARSTDTHRWVRLVTPFRRGGVVRILFTGVPGVADRPRCESVPGIAPQVTPPARVNTRVALQVSAAPRKTIPIPSTCPWPPAPSSPMNAEATFVLHDLRGRDGATCRSVGAGDMRSRAPGWPRARALHALMSGRAPGEVQTFLQ